MVQRVNDPGADEAKERRRAAQRRYKERYPERVKASQKRWQQKNPERLREAGRRYHAANREARNAALRDYMARRKYGMSRAEYESIIARGCAICGTHLNVGLDHDHATGKPRDALCGDHNSGLARFQDDPEMLERAAAYLREHGRG